MASGGTAATASGREARGLVPRCLEYLFSQIARETRRQNGAVEYSCRCSFFEIFNERVFDLLDAAAVSAREGSSTSSSSDRSSSLRSSRNSRNSNSSTGVEDMAGLQVREDQRRGVFVDGLHESTVSSALEASGVLVKGYRNRRVAETAMNRESSRSHAVFQLHVESVHRGDASGVKRSKKSRFSLVDLAGSERQKSTSAAGERLKEANAINASLSALGQVINALVDRGLGKMRHVPYRDSKLTFLLRDSLGGNSRTCLVAAVSPSEEQFGESLSTLKFSQRAKMITNTAVVNEDTVGNIETLQKEVARLKQELLKSQFALSHSQQASSQTAHQVVSPTRGANCVSSPGAVASAATPGAVSTASMDHLLKESLERFMVVHKRSLRYLHKQQGLRELSARVERYLHAANLTIKLLRRKQAGTPVAVSAAAGAAAGAAAAGSEPELFLSAKDAEVLLQVEKALVVLPEAEKWRAACDQMRGELNALTGAEDPEPSAADLGSALSTDAGCVEVLKTLHVSKCGRDKALGLHGVGATAWGDDAEAAFQVALQERFTKLMEERDALVEQYEALSEQHAQLLQQPLRSGAGASSAGPAASNSSSEDDLKGLFALQFGEDAGKPSLDILSLARSPPPPPLPPSGGAGAGRRSTGGRRSSVGRVSLGGGGVVQFATAQEANRKLREADAKADALAKQLAEKVKEVAEQSKLNATLQREKAELAAEVAAAGSGGGGSAEDGSAGRKPNTAGGGLADEAHVATAVAAAVAEAQAAAADEAAALRSELEAAQVARLEDQEAAAASEATLKALAQDEIEATAAAKQEMQAQADAAATEAAAAAAAHEAAAAARAEAAVAQEGEERAAARAKELEDEVETLTEQVAFMRDGEERAAATAEELAAKAAAVAEELEATKKALDDQRAAGQALQEQVLAAARADTAGAVEDLQRQLGEQAAKLAAALDDQACAEAGKAELEAAVARSARQVEDLDAARRAAQESERSAEGVAADLTVEVRALRDRAGAAEAAAAHAGAELVSVREDRDELAAAVAEAEAAAEAAREELEGEKAAFLEELAKQGEQVEGLEEALEAEQQGLMEAEVRHKDAAAASTERHAAEAAALRAELAAAIARAEQAEAEAAVLRKDTQRDVQEAERELLATQASLRQAEQQGREANAASALHAARSEEHARAAAEMGLRVSSLEGERAALVERAAARDSELEAAAREARALGDVAEERERRLGELGQQVAAAEAACAGAKEAAGTAAERAARLAEEAARSRAMEQESYEKASDLESKVSGLESQVRDAAGRIAELVEANATLVGHHNSKQKIHHHMKLKEENDELQRLNQEMKMKLHKLATREAKALALVTGEMMNTPTENKTRTPSRKTPGEGTQSAGTESKALALAMGEMIDTPTENKTRTPSRKALGDGNQSTASPIHIQVLSPRKDNLPIPPHS